MGPRNLGKELGLPEMVDNRSAIQRPEAKTDGGYRASRDERYTKLFETQ